jgi:hypothetical protein
MNLSILNKRNLHPDDSGSGGNDDFKSKLDELGLPSGAADFFKDDNDAGNDDNNNDSNDSSNFNGSNDDLNNNDNDSNQGNDDNDGNDDSEDLFDVLNKDFGFDYKPSENNTEVLDKIKDYVSHILSQTKSSERTSAINELIEENPLIEYALNGYSENVINYEKAVQDLEQLELTDDNEDIAKQIISEYHKSTGIDEEESEEIIATAIANNTLTNKANKAKDKLINSYKNLRDAQIQEEDNIRKTEEENYNNAINSVKTTIKKGFNGIVLTGKESEEFSNYITKTDDKRYTEADKAFYNLDVESKLTIDYIIKKGLIKDIAKFISNPSKTTNAINKKDSILKDLEKNNGRINLGNKNSSSASAGGDKVINIKDLKASLGL